MMARAEIGLCAASAMLFEIALTRVLGYVLSYHHAFFAVAAGIGGLGLGCAIASGRASGGATLADSRTRSLSAMAAALAFAITWLLTTRDVLSAAGSMVLVAVLAFAALVSLGVALGGALEAAARSDPAAGFGGRTYAADAFGALVGGLAALGLLEAAGPVAATALSAVTACGAAFLSAAAAQRRRAFLAGALAVLCALPAIFALSGDAGDAPAPPDSALTWRRSRGGERILSRWDAYARTDLIGVPHLAIEEIYSDGNAPALLVRDAARTVTLAAHRRDLPYLPYAMRRPSRVLALGGGAGYDAWLALASGATHVDTVDANATLVSIARSRRGTSADVLHDPRVHTHADDARRFVTRTTERYNLIVLALLQGASGGRASLALEEARAYTVEALRAYARRLAPGGRIAIFVHDDVYRERILGTARAALGSQAFVVAFEHAPSAPYRHVVYFGPEPASHNEVKTLATVRAAARFSEVTSRPTHAPPSLAPTHDTRPFFFHTERWPPTPLVWLAGIPLFVCLMLSRTHRTSAMPGTRGIAIASGAGFASAELLLFQQTLAGLGHPTLALVTSSLGMLLGAAAGAAVGARRSPPASRPNRALSCLLLAAMLIALGFATSIAYAVGAWPVALAALLWAFVSAAAGWLASAPLPFVLSLSRESPGECARLWALASLGSVASSAAFTWTHLALGLESAAFVPALAYTIAAASLARSGGHAAVANA
jgi:spermidine synthase